MRPEVRLSFVLAMASTGKVIKSLRSLAPSMTRAISSTSSSTQSVAPAAAKVTSAPAKEKIEFNYKDALNLECRLSEEEVIFLIPGFFW